MKNGFKKVISSLIAAAMLIGSLSFGCLAFAEDLVSINETNFPDKNFRSIIMQVYDANSNGFLEASERSRSVMTLAAYAEEICGEDATIDNLQGIEYFPNLTKLYCSGIGLNALDLSKNTNLTYVSASGNRLASVTLGNQQKLSNLDLSANELTSVDLSGCPNLTTLECFSNSLTALDVSMLGNLSLLHCQQNKLTALNLKNNPMLTNLYCSNNNLWELDLSANTNLSGITSSEIGNQWVSTTAYLQANKIYANHVFSKTSNLLSTSVDVVTDSEEGTTTTLGYANGNFFTSEVKYIKDKLVDENREKHDGILYKYNVNNANCENMTVNVVLSRGFYQVNYYLDATKQERLAYHLVTSGGSVTAPAVPDAPTCKKFVSWSGVANNVTEDKDIYIVWADDHRMHWNIDDRYNVSMYCEKCSEKTVSFNFLDALNAKRGQSNYVERGDVNNDGCINAKDFAIIIHY